MGHHVPGSHGEWRDQILSPQSFLRKGVSLGYVGSIQNLKDLKLPLTLWGIHGWSFYTSTTGYDESEKS